MTAHLPALVLASTLGVLCAVVVVAVCLVWGRPS